jgi:hypothetical protein
MDEQYLVDVDKQPIRNAIFRTLAGGLCLAMFFVTWCEVSDLYRSGWANFNIYSGIGHLLINVPFAILMGLFAIGGYDALDKPHRALDNGLQRLLDPNYKADASISHLGQQVDCPRRKKHRNLFYAARGLRPWR